MAKTVKTSDGKCWSEGVEVSCPNEKTQTRKMTSKSTPHESREDKLMKMVEAEKARRNKFSWGS